MITGWGTSTRLTKIVVHYYSEEDGLPLCRNQHHRRGPATIPKPTWDPAHPMTCHFCRRLLALRDQEIEAVRVVGGI